MNPDGTPKIAKSPRPAIACATPISPGMEIYTNTPGVKQMREGVLEFLLINHPLDCPICDQAGECKLQEYSVDYGQAASRFVEEKVHKPKHVDLGPRIVLDDERCIFVRGACVSPRTSWVTTPRVRQSRQPQHAHGVSRQGL